MTVNHNSSLAVIVNGPKIFFYNTNRLTYSYNTFRYPPADSTTEPFSNFIQSFVFTKMPSRRIIMNFFQYLIPDLPEDALLFHLITKTSSSPESTESESYWALNALKIGLLMNISCHLCIILSIIIIIIIIIVYFMLILVQKCKNITKVIVIKINRENH